MVDPDARREAAKAWLAAHPVEFRPGFYIECDGVDVDDDHHGEWCEAHARRAARLLTRLWRNRPGAPEASACACRCGADRLLFCQACGVPLDVGGIIDPAPLVEEMAEEFREGGDMHLRACLPHFAAWSESMAGADPAWPLLCDLIERAAKVVSDV